MNYDELLDISHVPTLENRRLFLCLCTFYNIIHGFVFFPPHLLPNLCNTRTNYSLTYNIPFAHTIYILAAPIFAHSFASLELLT